MTRIYESKYQLPPRSERFTLKELSEIMGCDITSAKRLAKGCYKPEIKGAAQWYNSMMKFFETIGDQYDPQLTIVEIAELVGIDPKGNLATLRNNLNRWSVAFVDMTEKELKQRGVTANRKAWIERLAASFPQGTEEVTHNQMAYHLGETRVQMSEVCGRYDIPFRKLNGESYAERSIAAFIRSLGVEVQIGVYGLFSNSRLEADMYLPESDIVIEYNGIRYHSELLKAPLNMSNKTQTCLASRLIHIDEDDWFRNPLIVMSRLASLLGKNKARVYARKCQIVDLPRDLAKPFLDESHLQGYRNGATYKGLVANGELVACMGFVKDELVRFACCRFTTVVGGFSRLLKAFNKPRVVSFADLRHSDGAGYLACGFKLDSVTKESYRYFKSGAPVTLHKMGFRKDKLASMSGFKYNPALTEWENMQANGYNRIWDCGKLKLVKGTDSQDRQSNPL